MSKRLHKISRKGQVLAFLAACSLLLAGCGANPTTAPAATDSSAPAATTDAVTETSPATDTLVILEDAAHVTVDLGDTKQTIDGFGAGFTWYSDMAVKSPYSEEIMAALFDDAKLSILRFKNEYGYSSFKQSAETNLAYYTYAKAAAESRNETIKILYTSWSPTADLKSNNSINGGGSLKKDENGNYVYGAFADWWTESVKAYREYGIAVDYVSIQNECDFVASYDGCELKPTETSDYASYADAFLATVEAFSKEFPDDMPYMIGPETMSCEPGSLKAYLKKILEEKPDSIYGVAHHLYVGGTSTDDPNYCNADSFILNFMDDASFCAENNLKAWQTEFYRGTPLQTANVINNSLVYENANAYIYWGGVWKGDKSKNLDSNDMVSIATAMGDWPGPHGYLLTGDYYVMRHYSEFIRPDYVRVEGNHDGGLNVRMSAYLSPDKSRLVLILINNGTEDMTFQLSNLGFTVTESQSYQSSFYEGYTAEDMYQSIGALGENQTLVLKQKSITTVVLDGHAN